MELIGGIVLALSLLFNFGQHKQVEQLEQDVYVLESQLEQANEVAEANARAADESAEVAENNGMVARGLGADLNSCAEKLRNYEASIAVFDKRRQADAVAIEALEDRLGDTDLDQCRVPGWLVGEVTRDNSGS